MIIIIIDLAPAVQGVLQLLQTGHTRPGFCTLSFACMKGGEGGSALGQYNPSGSWLWLANLYPLLWLSSNLQAQQEVDQVMGGRQQPTMQDYTELKYVMRCVNESMRLYPHPPVLLRRAMVQDELPGDYLCPVPVCTPA